MNIKNIKNAFIVVIILIISNFSLFIFFFHNQNISADLSDWANFANYIGSTTNVLISFLTLIITFFIAFEITRMENTRNKLNLEYDNKKFKRGLREKEYSEITDNLNNIWFAVTDENRRNASQSFYVIRTRFVNFLRHKEHLFPDLKTQEFNGLDNTLIRIIENSSMNLDENHPEIIKLIDEYQKEVATFHRKMQEYIVSH